MAPIDTTGDRAVGAWHNSSALRRAFEHHHGEAERAGHQSLQHRRRAATELWRYRQGFEHGAWERELGRLPVSPTEARRYLLAGQFLEKNQDGLFDDFAHLLRVAGDWRAERDAEEARQAAQEAREREAEAKQRAEEATQAKERERAEQRAKREAARAEKAERKASEKKDKVAARKEAAAVLDEDSSPKSPGASKYRGSGSNQYYTPAYIIEAVREVMGAIALDPASCEQAQQTVRAEAWYGEDALGREWTADTLWLNPPYSSRGDEAVVKWVSKLVSAYERGLVKQACLLLHACTDTQYGQVALSHCAGVCFHAGRIRFEGPSAGRSGAQIGQMICYYGEHRDRFAQVFAELGAVLVFYQSVLGEESGAEGTEGRARRRRDDEGSDEQLGDRDARNRNRGAMRFLRGDQQRGQPRDGGQPMTLASRSTSIT